MMQKHGVLNKAALLGGAVMIWFVTPLLAQETPGASDHRDGFQAAQVDNKPSAKTTSLHERMGTDSDGEPQLETIIVTAQKRAEDLQKVPVSVQVFSGQTLAEQNYNTLAGLTEMVPDVHIAAGQASNQLFVRGIGSGDNAFFDQSVATFVDDIYHGRSRMSGATFLDLDRIEILKGPQSTFFGNNAIAGALNIVTKKPGDQVDAWGRALYGQFGQYAVEGAIGGPITDTFGARLAVTRNGVDRGWIYNVNLGQYEPRVNNLAGRLTLAFNPSENLDATFKIEGSELSESGAARETPFQWTYCPPPLPFMPGDMFDNFGACAQALALGPSKVPIGLNNNRNTGLPGLGNWLSTFEDVLTINYQKWGQTFTSVSGFYNYHFKVNSDPIDLPVWLNTLSFPEKYHQFSEEFRITSPAGQPIEYMAGVYVQTDRLDADDTGGFPVVNFLGVGAGVPSQYLPLGVLTGSSQGEHVKSIFGSLIWNVTDQVKINGGIRGTSVGKDLSGANHYGTATQIFGGFVQAPPAIEQLWSPVLGPPGTGENLGRSDHGWMPSAGIQYFIVPETMLYFSYSKGFKAGGLNGSTPLESPQNTNFGPEHVNDYEWGVKSKWFEDTVLVNLGFFRSNYSGLQVNAYVFDPFTGGFNAEIRNAASSISQGVEFEGQWAVTKQFELTANVAYLESHYVSYPNAPQTNLEIYCATTYVPQYCSKFPNPVPAYRDLSGQPTPYSPRWSGSLTATYSITLPGGYKFITELSPYVQSSYNPDPDRVYPPLGGYYRLDARLSLESPANRWALDVVAKNVTDRVIPLGEVGGGGQPVEAKEQPRNVALQVRYKY